MTSFKKRYISFLLPFCAASASFGQEIENVRFIPHENKVLITYDLIDAKPTQRFEITVYCSLDDYTHPLKSVSGDGVGKNIFGGTEKKIYWDAGQDLQVKELKSSAIDFEVLGMLQEDSAIISKEEMDSFIQQERADSLEWAIKQTLALDSADQKQPNRQTDNPKKEEKHPRKDGGGKMPVPSPPPYSDKQQRENLPEMVLVKGGIFRMGSKTGEPDENPEHIVKLPDFYIAKYETSNAEYCVFLNAEKKTMEEVMDWMDLEDPDCMIEFEKGLYKPKKGCELFPVIEVNWFGADAYCKWAGGRLPTEAEWEYVAKGGHGHGKTRHRFSGGDKINEVAWYSDNSGNKTHAVGGKSPNYLGVYDMSGNVWEWCQDWYGAKYYSHSPKVNPQGPLGTRHKVIRGGSWSNYDLDASTFRRGRFPPDDASNANGFRMAKPSK